MVEHARERALALGDELAVVVLAVLDAEALGQPTAPGALLAGGGVVGPRHDVGEHLERLESGGIEESRSDQDVLVGEGEHGAPVLVGHDRLEHGVALARALDRREPDEHARRAADALEGAVGEALQLSGFTGERDQDPQLGLLREQTRLEPTRPFGADVGHFGQLGVGELRAVLGLDLNRHEPRCPRR